jgi:hypothetical protein
MSPAAVLLGGAGVLIAVEANVCPRCASACFAARIHGPSAPFWASASSWRPRHPGTDDVPSNESLAMSP